MSKKIVTFILIILTIISIFLHFFRWNNVLPCLNVDELSYGYNAYSILLTGKDEFGVALPLRLQSFGDYKLPFYSYSLIPFIKFFGLTDFAVRLPTVLSAIFLIWVMYFLALELFQNKRLAIFAAFLTTFSPWINTIFSRHAHEAVLTTLLLCLSLLFMLRFFKKKQIIMGLVFIIFGTLALYTYHFGRLFYGLFFTIFLAVCIYKKFPKKVYLTICFIAIILAMPFIIAEIKTPPTRLSHLLITSHPGLKLEADELKTEFLYSPFNKRPFLFMDKVINRFTTYFSPQFLFIRGDENPRFGFSGINLLTIAEYLLLITGIFWFIQKLNSNKLLILSLLLLSPLPGALTWQENSLNRVFFMIVPIILINAFVFDKILQTKFRFKPLIISLTLFTYIFFTARSFEFFIFHYPKRPIVIRAWDCGLKEIANITKVKYDKYKKFYITNEAGQSYIALLFYQKYSPLKFQKFTKRLPADNNGFTQISSFDKYVFNITNFRMDKPTNDLYFLSNSQAQDLHVPDYLVDKITFQTENLFWIYPAVKPKAVK